MTILYPFSYLIEQGSTSATVLAPFGHLFDGDEAGPGGSALPAIVHHYRQLMTA